MKDAWPISAQSVGGRHYRGTYIDQNFDSYGTEYTFADGSKLLMDGRLIDGCHTEFASYAHGSKGSCIISTSGHAPSRCRMYKGQSSSRKIWFGSTASPSPTPTRPSGTT